MTNVSDIALAPEILTQLLALPAQDLSTKLPSFAVVALQLRGQSAQNFEILLIHRAQQANDPWSGQLAFPGGRGDAGETPDTTLRREYHEELGTQLGASATYRLDDIQGRKGGNMLPFFIRPYAFFDGQSDFKLQASEVQSFFWFPLRRLWDRELHTHLPLNAQNAGHLPRSLQLPAVRVAGEPLPLLWGLSYLMLQDLMRRLVRVGLFPSEPPWSILRS